MEHEIGRQIGRAPGIMWLVQRVDGTKKNKKQTHTLDEVKSNWLNYIGG